jgi:hypothetical protein
MNKKPILNGGIIYIFYNLKSHNSHYFKGRFEKLKLYGLYPNFCNPVNISDAIRYPTQSIIAHT